MPVLSKTAIRRLIKEYYPDDMVSSKAVDRMLAITEDFIRMTYLDAKKYTQARNRKIVSEKDVILASS
jgi:histone H3/H4